MGTDRQKNTSGITNLEEKRLRNRKLGLLGIHASREECSTPCPSSTEMALFVEQKISQVSADRILNHLAQCEDCYKEWMVLSEILSAKKTHVVTRRTGFFFSRRSLAAVGSGLALAASVTIFLNLPQKQVEDAKIFNLEKEESVVAVQKSDTIDGLLQDRLAAAAMEEKRKKRTASASPQKSSESMVALKEHNKTVPAARTVRPEPGSPLKTESGYLENRLDSQMLGSLSSQVPPLEKFKQDVLTFCRQQDGAGQEGNDFKQLQLKGRDILRLSLSLSEKQEQFLKHMVLFNEHASKDKSDFCKNAAQIFDLQLGQKPSKNAQKANP
jgi:hypothetical protein